MKTTILKAMTLALLPAAVITFTSCSSTPEGMGASQTIETPDGIAVTETFTTTATVTGIDHTTRKITLVSRDGRKTEFTAGPEVRNFDQIRLGDQVRATMTEEVAVMLQPAGQPLTAQQTATVQRAPIGSTPGARVTSTRQVTARIVAVDASSRKVTLQFPDNTTRKIKVGENVNLARVKPGDTVTTRLAESVAVSVERR